MRTLKVSLGLLAALCVTMLSLRYYEARSAYYTAIQDGPALTAIEESEDLMHFLDNRNNPSWSKSEESDYGMSKVIGHLGLGQGLDGLINFYTLDYPPFSGFRNERNLKFAALAIVRSGLLHGPNDGKLHISRALEVAVVFSGKVVTVYTYKDGRVYECVYIKKNEPNKAMEPTPVDVTVPADAGTAPSTSVAHL